MKLYISLLGLIVLIGCSEHSYTPKPIAYPRINFPEKSGFVPMQEDGCAYTFEYPKNTQIVRDTVFFNEDVSGKCWINVVYPELNGTVYLSYKKIGEDITLEKVLEDSHELAYTHTKKADYIDELSIKNPYGVEGLMFEVGGDAATNMQFYLTDFEEHYVRGALYFKATPNADSIAPVLDYVRSDLMHLFDTFQWQ